MPRPIVAIVGNTVYLLPPAEGPVQQAEHARRLIHAYGIAEGRGTEGDKALVLVPHGLFVLRGAREADRDPLRANRDTLAAAVAWVAALNADLVTLEPSEVA